MTNRKEGKTGRVKSLVDDLALTRYPLNDSRVTSYTLNCLGVEFKKLIIVFRVRDSPISIEHFYDKITRQGTNSK